jgi:chromosomal replication initiator protein
VISGVFSLPTAPENERSAPVSPSREHGWLLRDYIGGPENCLVKTAYDQFLVGDYNPIVLFGPTCSGKTLLLRALAARWQSEHDNNIYATAGADFARLLAHSLEIDATDDLRQQCASASLLIVDNLEELREKPAAQQFLTQLIDSHLRSGSQLLFSCAESPALIAEFQPAMRSRLLSGLSIPIALPSPATRFEIVERLAQISRLDLPNDVRELLANDTEQRLSLKTVPQLHHAVVQLAHQFETIALPLNRDAVLQLLMEDQSCSAPPLKNITKAVCRYFGFRMSDIVSSSRRRAIVRARGVAIHLSRQLTNHSLEQIGKHFGGRDHTTVLHACRQTEKLLQTDPATREAIHYLESRLTTATRA